MKVLISANLAWNVANFRGGLVRALLSDGHEVVVVAPADAGAERLIKMGCRFVPLVMDNQGSSPLRDTVLFARYRRLMQTERPDVYLGFTVKPNIWGTLAARTVGVPVVSNVSGLGTAFIRNTWLTRVVKGLYRIAFSSASTVFFQNSDDCALFISERLVQSDAAVVLPGSGIDLEHFSFALPRAGEGIVFLLVARLLWDKGVGEYVEAARLLKTRVPQAKCRILGFLDVPNRTAVARTEMDSWVAEGVVTFLGSTDDVRTHLRDADCVVLPSYREGTPRTLLEAAATGRPLIATDVPGCREPVEEGRNGFLCRVRDAADLARAMEMFSKLSPAQRTAMGQASRSIVETRYAESLVIDAYRAAIAHATNTAAHPGTTKLEKDEDIVTARLTMQGGKSRRGRDSL